MYNNGQKPRNHYIPRPEALRLSLPEAGDTLSLKPTCYTAALQPEEA